MLAPAKSKLGRKYGYRPPPEFHPMVFRCRQLPPRAEPPPGPVSWRSLLRPVRDQGQEGSCFAHAVAALKEFNCVTWEIERGGPAVPLGGYLSVAYLSWRTRLAEGTFPEDSGASLADAMAILQAWGAPPETFLPYNQDPTQAGNAGCDLAAQAYRVKSPVTVALDPTQWRAVLAARKVIAVGFQVFESFEDTGSDGVVAQVRPGEASLGGHAVDVIGWDPSRGKRGLYEVRNSWGTGWGDAGHCWWPEEYLANVFESWTTA